MGTATTLEVFRGVFPQASDGPRGGCYHPPAVNDSESTARMIQRSLLLVLLAATWAALSWRYSSEPLVFVLALASLAVVWWIGRRMEAVDGLQALPFHSLGMFARQLRYLPYLALQVVSANLTIARLVFQRRVLIEPRILRVRAGQRTALGRVIYANSITLTPGTVTLDVRDDEFLVHALLPASAGSILDGEMDREVSRLEGTV